MSSRTKYSAKNLKLLCLLPRTCSLYYYSMREEVAAIYFQTWVTAAVALVVGSAAFGVYIWQKRDQKKTAARILLVEIENAERQLSIIKKTGNDDSLSESVRLMPTTSWEKYRHLFGRTFTSREWDTVSDFYNRCSQYDKAVDYDSTSITRDIEAWRTSVNHALALVISISLLNDSSGQLTDREFEDQYRELGRRLTEVYMKPSNLFIYKPVKPLKEATDALKELTETLSLTSVGDKLRKVSRPNLWQRIFNSI